MKRFIAVLFTALVMGCSPAPKDENGNITNYSTIGGFKGHTIYQVDRGYGNVMYVAVKDSVITAISTSHGKTDVHTIIIDGKTVSKDEALKKLMDK